MKFGSNIDLAKLELQNARIQNLSSAPSSPVEGQVYYDTVLHQFGCFQNSTWTYLSATISNGVTKTSNAAASGVMEVSGGADKTLVDYAGGAGLVKSAANGVVSAATPGTDYVTGSSTNTFTNKTIDAAGTGNSISNLATSNFASNVVDTDTSLTANSNTRLASQAAIKAYVDNISQGIKWKASVRAATTTTGTLASAYANASVIDGVTLATGDRILIKDQSTGTENGIYVVAASGAPTRATDADTGTEIKQAAVFVEEGTTNADKGFVATNNGTITLGSTSIVFSLFTSNSASATTSSAGVVTLATQAEAEAKTDTAKAVVPADLLNFPIKKTFTIGDGSTTAISVTDNLGTTDKIAQVRDASTNAVVLVDITYATNTTTFTFAVAPASNTYKVVIFG